MKPCRWVFAGSLCFIAAVASSSARAAAPASAHAAALPRPSDASPALASAEAAFLEGRRLMQHGLPRDACARFADSAAAYSTAVTSLNVGNCYEQGHLAGGLVEAKRTFEQALREADRIEDSSVREPLRREVRRRLERVDSRLPRVRLRRSATPDAEIFINGVRIHRLDQPVRLNPGRYQLEQRSDDCRTFTDAIELRSGARLDYALPALKRCRFGYLPEVLTTLGALSAVLWSATAIQSKEANGKYGRLVDRCAIEDCDQAARGRLRTLRQEAKDTAFIADVVLLPATTALLGTALGLWWFDDATSGGKGSASSRAVRLEATYSRPGFWLSVEASF